MFDLNAAFAAFPFRLDSRAGGNLAPHHSQGDPAKAGRKGGASNVADHLSGLVQQLGPPRRRGTGDEPKLAQKTIHVPAEVHTRDRLRMRISGAKAAELVTGMVTNDVSALVPGEGQYAAALTPKGKIVADLRIFALEEALLIDTSAASAPGWKEMVRKYVNPRIAPYHDSTSELSDLGLFGRSACSIVARLMDIDDKDLAGLAPYGHITRPFGGVTVIVARVPEIDLDGFEIFIPSEAVGSFPPSAIPAE